MKIKPTGFIDQPIQVIFDSPPLMEKSPPCPDGFIWKAQTFRVVAKISEWFDFTRRGRFARNMQPGHASTASRRGSLGVGRFYFTVRTDSGRSFDIYYDRVITSADHRKGCWFLYRELSEIPGP